jgi:Na+-transporting methylmalonyl-CoA/oxaloacetate decarboxylase gamma subunit
VKIPQMVRAGVMLNFAGIALVTAFAYLVILPMLTVGRAP